MSEIAYPALAEIENMVEEGTNILADAALVAILADVPWLNLPIIKQMFTATYNFCISRFWSGFKLVVDTSAIHLKNGINETALDREGVKLKIIAKNFGVNSEEFKKQKEVYREKLHTFVRYGATLGMRDGP